jgi:hypothetical protein
MKTLLVLVSVAGFATPAFAQDASTPTTSTAAGGIRVGIQADGAKITGDAADAFGFGFGFGARAGYELHMGQILLTPELAVNWDRWSVNLNGQDLGSAWILGVMPGVRAGYAMGSVTPYLAFHVGLDHGGGGMTSTDKLGLNVGGGADIALSKASIGPFVAYNIDFTDNQSTNWISFGIGGSLGL